MEERAMKLTSSAIESGGQIPCKYTCDGQNLSPPLSISDVPPKTKGLVLILDEVEVPGRYRHLDKSVSWVVFNVPQNIRDIEEGHRTAGTYGVVEAGRLKYHGPCPSEGEHLYSFKVYALDTELTLSQDATPRQVMKALGNHVLATAELLARYEINLTCQIRPEAAQAEK
jgi:Raf kinase inhibitor-like YbhB/YbcL family protein